MKNEFELAFNEIKDQRALPQEVILEALQTALVSAYRRYSGAGQAQAVEAIIMPGTGRTKIMVEKEVVSEVQNPLTEVSLEKARYYNPEANLNETVMVQVEGTTKKFGRIAAQTAKQVILQKIREAERASVYEEYRHREGDVVSGTIQTINNGNVTVMLGRAEATLPRNQQISSERYRQHEKIRVYIVEVKNESRGPKIIVSRSHRNFLKRLLEFEVPEISNGQIEIKNIVREAGYRSKVAVVALQEGIDPVGACVGMRGIRIQNIVRELHEEKIDVIQWVPDAKQFLAKALNPAQTAGVFLEDDPELGRNAVVLVPDNQLSLAIGVGGQNARLAARLTGWRIDIKGVDEAVNFAIDHLDEQPLNVLQNKHADIIAQVRHILDKKRNEKVVTADDLQVLNRFANLAEERLFEVRQQKRASRIAEIDAVKSTLPPILFNMSIHQLGVSKSIEDKLEDLDNVGEVMWRFLIDEQSIAQRLRGLSAGTFDTLKVALDDVMLSAVRGTLVIAPLAQVDEPTSHEPLFHDIMGDIVPYEDSRASLATATSTTQALPDEATNEDDVPTLAFPDAPATDEQFTSSRRSRSIEQPAQKASDLSQPLDFMLKPTFDEEDEKPGAGKKKGNSKKNRKLVYDDESGRMVTKKQRKRRGGREDDWRDLYG
jgi:N utilization substance protein A